MEEKYTCFYYKWLIRNVTIIIPGTNGSFVQTAFQNEVTNKGYSSIDVSTLYDMLLNVYRFYEIGEDDDEHLIMFNFLVDVFREYAPYYNQVIQNYNKEYDYALNNKRTITKSDKLNMVGNTNISNEQNGSTTRYDLPNKVVPSSNWRSTPSDITDTEESSSNNKDYTNDTTRDSTTTTEFNNEFIDLKNKYMNQIRNVYREFAMKFKDCFYQVY